MVRVSCATRESTTASNDSTSGRPLSRSSENYRASPAAGSSCTDSPQPQAEVWLGLLKTNCAESLSTLIHFGAEQEQHRLGIDQDAHAFVLDHLIQRIDLRGIFHGVGHAGAAAVFHADAHS